MNMKYYNTWMSVVLASFLYEMKNIVVELQICNTYLYVMKNIVVGCQKMCYNLKRVIVLQGGSFPNLKKEGRWCRWIHTKY